MGIPGLLGIMSALIVALPADAAGRDHGLVQPLRHGVVFWQEKLPEEAIAELEKVKADGFNLIEQASWAWTLPTPGSPLEAVMQAELDWCDRNEFHFFLLQNVQYGSPGEGGGLDDAWQDPLRAAPLLTDWVRVLRGHPCVDGVILGNEVSPVAGNPQDNPAWWAGFTAAMQQRYGTVDALNRVWGTTFGAWEALALPTSSAGRTDLNRFAVEAYARFYGTLLDEVLRPALGDLEYGTKTAGDPLLHRRLTRFSSIMWDDVLANYPQWRIKAMCDVGRRLNRPVFNSELHLYNDTYAYNQSVAMARYRYFTSALNGETTTASFAWHQWNQKPETIEIHRHTPETLAELRRLEPQLRLLAGAAPSLHVLLTPAITEGDDTDEENRPLAERLYAEVAGLGIPWEFICEEDVSELTVGVLLLPEQPRVQPTTAQSICDLPKAVTVICLDEAPTQDEYGRMLPQSLRAALIKRARAVESVGHLLPPDTDPGPPYNQVGQTEYLWWSEAKGHFRSPVTCPLLEARRVRDGDGWLVAVINHATEGEPVLARLPWLTQLAPQSVRELIGEGGRLPPTEPVEFAPLAVRVFRYSEVP
jgi:hypothetical protein